MNTLSVRARLTLWHAAVLAVIVCVFAAAILLFLRARLSGELDAQLARTIAAIDRVYREEPAELGDLAADRGYHYFQIEEGSKLRFQTDAWKQLGRTPHRSQVIEGPDYRITAAVDETPLRHTLWLLSLVLLGGIPFAIALALVGGYFLAGRVLKPVGAMADKARAITAESLSERLPVANPADEFGRLAGVFNDTLARLESAFERLRRFTADASHELRTPLTAMRSVGEVALQGTHDAAAYRDVIGSMLEEVDRLTGLVDSLLTLTRADSGAIRLARERLDLGEVAASVVEHLRVLADDKGQAIALQADAAAPVLGDAAIVRVALVNVVHNAIKYTPRGGSIRLVARREGDREVLEVRDTGPGIAAGHRDKVFERFYRVDAGRSSDAGGAGLGLAIARWAIEAHGGRLELDGEEGKGALFRIVLNAAP